MKEFYDFADFRKYLLNVAKKPFNCPYVRTLSEDIKDKCEGGRYVAGDVLCTQKPGSIGITRTHRCSISGDVVLDDAGELELRCGWNLSKFKLKIVDFEPKKNV